MSLSTEDLRAVEARIQPLLITWLREARAMGQSDPATYIKQQFDSAPRYVALDRLGLAAAVIAPSELNEMVDHIAQRAL